MSLGDTLALIGVLGTLLTFTTIGFVLAIVVRSRTRLGAGAPWFVVGGLLQVALLLVQRLGVQTAVALGASEDTMTGLAWVLVLAGAAVPALLVVGVVRSYRARVARAV